MLQQAGEKGHTSTDTGNSRFLLIINLEVRRQGSDI